MVGLGDCGSSFTNLKTKKMIAGEYLVRPFLSIQQALGKGGLDNAYCLPRVENPVDGLTEARSATVPLFRLSESGRFNSGPLRPLRGVAWRGRIGRV